MHEGYPPHAEEDEAEEARPLGEGGVERTRRSTGWGELDALLGRPEAPGVVDGFVYYIIGPPGAGKTTLALKILESSPETPLCLSAEQPESEVAARARELAITREILFAGVTEMGAIERLCHKHRPRDVVIDSIGCVYDARSGRPPGSNAAVEHAMLRIYELAHSLRITAWVLGHVNAKGRARGTVTTIHWCDCLLAVRGQGAEPRELYFPRPLKNRGGQTGGALALGNWP